MNKYENGKIYKVICSETERVYIGSTIRTLKSRFANHKNISNGCLTKGFINPKIELIENYSCQSKKELLEKEKFYIQNIKCINKQNPIRTKEELRKYDRELYQKNKLKRLEWNFKNKDRLNYNARQYSKNNKDKIKEAQLKCISKQNILITCECGKEIKKYGMPRHIKSKYHITRISPHSPFRT